MNDNARLAVILSVFAAFAKRQDPDLDLTVDYLLSIYPTITNVDVSFIVDESEAHAFRVHFNDDCPVIIFAFFDDNDRITHALASTDTEPYDVIYPLIGS